MRTRTHVAIERERERERKWDSKEWLGGLASLKFVGQEGRQGTPARVDAAVLSLNSTRKHLESQAGLLCPVLKSILSQ